MTLRLETQHNGRWKQFIPLDVKWNAIMELHDERPISDIVSDLNKTGKIYGKICVGVSGYSPIWMYLTVPKDEIRIRKAN